MMPYLQLHISIEVLEKGIMKLATATTCLPIKHCFEKEFFLTKKTTIKPPH